MRTNYTLRWGAAFLCLSLMGLLTPLTALGQTPNCDVSWNNASGGNWSTASNWDTGVVPTSSDDACIILDATYTVTLDVAATVNSLTLGATTGNNTQTLLIAGNNLTLNSPSTINDDGVLDWQSNSILGGSMLTNEGLIHTSTNAAQGISANLVNNGTFEHGGTFSFFVDSGFELVNNGLFDFLNDGNVGGSGSTFTNTSTGIVRKSVGTGASEISPLNTFTNNGGTIDVQIGQLRLDGGGAATLDGGTYSVASGATFDIGIKNVVYRGTLSGTPAGSIRQLSSTSVHADGATFDFDGTGFQWASGTISGPGTLTNDGLIQIIFAGNKTITTTLINDGTFGQDGLDQFIISNGGTVQNNGLWDVQDDGDLAGSGGTPGTFLNQAGATFQKSGGSGLTRILNLSLTFDNAGTIDVQTGEVRFERPSTHTNATLNVSLSSAKLLFQSTTTFTGTISGTADGTLEIDTNFEAGAGGATWDIGGDGVEWTAGDLTAGTLANDGLVRLTGTSNLRGVNGPSAEFHNDGTFQHIGTGQFRISNDGTVENSGLWDVQDDGDLSGSGGSAGIFLNQAGATFRKSGSGADQTRIVNPGLTFNNSGTIDVQTGEVRFEQPSTHTDATLNVASGALLNFHTDMPTFIGTISGTADGTLEIDTNFEAGASGATWDIGGTGVEWTAGDLTAGTLANDGLVRLTGTSNLRGVNGPSAEFHNDGTFQHIGTGQFRISNDGTVENSGLWDVQDDGDLSGSGGSAGIFLNQAGATFRKSGSGADQTRIVNPGLTFNNSGTIDVQDGDLRFERPSTHTDATLNVALGALLNFDSDVPTFTGTISGTVNGTLEIGTNFQAGAGGATWNIGGTGVEWTSGDLTSGEITNEALVRLTGTSNLRGVSGAMGAMAEFHNNGTFQHVGTGDFRIRNDGTVENSGLWDVQDDGDLTGSGGTPGTFLNQAGATFRKSGTSTQTRILSPSLIFDNSGTIDVQAGELSVERPFDHKDGALIQGTGEFDIVSSSFTHDGDTGPGASPGILTWTGDYAPSSSAELLIEIGGPTPGTDHDQLQVSGNATLDGDLTVSLTGGFTPADGDQFTVLTASSVSEAFANAPNSGDQIVVNSGLSFTVTYNPDNVVLEANVQQLADLAITKTASTATPDVGVPFTFTLTVVNDGPNDASGIVVNDLLPGGLTYQSDDSGGDYDPTTGDWSVGSLANGDNTTLEITATADAPGGVTNTATITASSPADPDNSDNSDDDTINASPVEADLELTKIVDNATPNVGDNVTFTLTLANNGPADATSIVVNDLLPSGLSYQSHNGGGAYSSTTGEWNVSSLASGNDVTLEIVAEVIGTGSITNTAEVTASDQPDPDSTPGNNEPTEDDQDSAVVGGQAADLDIDKIVSDNAPIVGSTVTYTLTATNIGPSNATNVVVTDDLPSGVTYVSDNGGSATSESGGTVTWTIGTLAVNANPTLTIDVTVDAAGAITNEASVSGDQADTDPNNNTDDASFTGVEPTLSADLSITKVATPNPVETGGSVTFTLEVENLGPDDATGVKVQETPPAGFTFVSASGGSYDDNSNVWTIGNLTSGSTATIDLTFTAASTAGGYDNQATVSGNEDDPNTNNNTDIVTVDVFEPAVCDIPTNPEDEVLDQQNRTLTTSFFDQEGIDQVFFSVLNNLVVQDSDGFANPSNDNVTWVWPSSSGSPPQNATFVLKQADQGNLQVSYFAVITDACTDPGPQVLDQDPVRQFEVPLSEQAFALESGYPNPSAGPTTLRFSLADASPVTLTIYDVMGRKVAALLNKELSAGGHAVVWDGRADNGRVLASGLYLVRLQAGRDVAVRRLTLVR